MRKVASGVQKSLYPLDYNKNNPMEGYNEWMRYIYQQNELSSAKEAHCYVIVVNFVNADRVADAKVMNLLLEEANEIINPNK